MKNLFDNPEYDMPASGNEDKMDNVQKLCPVCFGTKGEHELDCPNHPWSLDDVRMKYIYIPNPSHTVTP